MPTLSISATTDYRNAPNNALVNGQSITDIVFGGSAITIAFFNSNQFGGNNISSTVNINGNSWTNEVHIFGAAGLTAFSAANFTLSNWSSLDRIIFFDAGGDQTWTGSSDADLFEDGAGNDTYNGGSGEDVFTFGASTAGNDSIIGGSGIRDVLDYGAMTQAVVVSLFAGTATGLGIGSDVFSGIEWVVGGSGNDSILGNADANDFEGGAGNDTLNGAGGIDRLTGGNGDDTYFVDSSNDTVVETNANVATGGYDTVSSSATFTLPFHVERLLLTGAAGAGIGNELNNVIDARAITGGASLSGQLGNDLIYGGVGADALTGGAGEDTLIGGAGADTLSGDLANNPLGQDLDVVSYATATAAVALDLRPALGVTYGAGSVGDAAGDRFYAIEGVIGSNFSDTMTGSDRADTLWGGAGSDSLNGDFGDDLIEGGANNDTLDGGFGNDLLFGGEGTDTVLGSGELDFIDGGLGADSMSGGDGFDSVSWYSSSIGVAVNMSSQLLNDFGAAGDQLGGFEAYYLTEFGDVFTNDGLGGYVYGFGGADVLIGGTGTDFLAGGAGGDTINGGAGFDYTSYGNAASGIRLDFTNMATNTGEAAGDQVSNVEAFYLTAQNDVFIGQSGQNIVFGGDGDDQLNGGLGANDWLFGEAGNDFLSGGSLDDLLAGGAGADTYAFASWVGNGFDSILDFVSGQDKFQLTGSGFGLLAGTAITNGFNFVAGAAPAATGARGTLLYATGTGILSYDPDGTGAGAAIALAQILGAPTLVAGDFIVA